MVPLVLAAMFLGLVTTASGQPRGLPLSPGGYGNIVRPATGNPPVHPVVAWHNFFGRPVSAARPTSEAPHLQVRPSSYRSPMYDNSNRKKNRDVSAGRWKPGAGDYKSR